MRGEGRPNVTGLHLTQHRSLIERLPVVPAPLSRVTFRHTLRSGNPTTNTTGMFTRAAAVTTAQVAMRPSVLVLTTAFHAA